MTDTELTFLLDAKHKALRSGNRWAIQRRQPDGSWDTLRTWSGGRRSLLQWCDENGVYPTRDAEAALALLPEGSGFKERS